MPNSVVVSPTPPGAGRSYHTYDYIDSNLDASQQSNRPGGNTNHASTNRAQTNGGPTLGGIAAVAQNTRVSVARDGANVNMGQYNGGSMVLVPYISVRVVQPTGKPFAWPLGRFDWEAVVSWSAIPGNGAIDSGMMLSDTDHARIAPASNMNDGLGVFLRSTGFLTFASRGAGGYEEVDLSAFANNWANLNKVKITVRSATSNAPASVEVAINDVPAVKRQWIAGHKLPAFVTGSMFQQIVNAEAGKQFYYAQTQVYLGPDVVGL